MIIMIDEQRTLEIYGYTSDELKPKSNKLIVALCDRCGTYRDTPKYAYTDLCKSCAGNKRWEDPLERERASIASKKANENDPTIAKRKSIAMKKTLRDDPSIQERHSVKMKKRYEDPAEREKISVGGKKRFEDPAEREKMSIVVKKRYEDPTEREKMSAIKQGIPYEEWKGFAKKQRYCPKFNEEIKQYIRDKYDNCDYITGIPAHICNQHRKLDVHHVDYNKQQGCDDHEWRLIPVSARHNAMFNTNRPFWNKLFTYSLQYDKTYYDKE